ncbi:flagellar type III secretion system protein FlhB [Roseisolibacter sp. H3M3-2]|uniref:EscU/YscU/HrcU family type III secretion system export apparatus switch protein n=1 Tax=Roseisolibacter sp. H3M3-2 TaxID=3031323 RepID=UPI0023DBA6BC|nr:flagellar type III secretion system protein FlhB [Roseisolibacter sp. H3M3-2]MDF1504246.1 flagellar type III secretion system protein FlhB [Roseisolibacter sp. H3M3-2]
MADSDQEKTEEPTERRRQDAAADGQIPKSQDLNAAVLLLASSLALGAAGPGLARAMRDVMGSGLGFASATGLTGEAAVALLRGLGWKTLAALAAFLGAMTAAALAISAVQGRGTFTLKPLAPKFERIDPSKGIKKIVGTQTAVELVKSLLKLAIVGWAVWSVLRTAWPEITVLGAQPPRAMLEVARKYGLGMLTKAGFAYLALAAADYGWQVFQHEKQLRMTKEEVKQEMKNQEGDPMVKQRMRALGRQRARQQMFRDVPTADVVVVNPVHIAVALKYDPSVAPAPYVVAVGRRKVAERIKQLAFDSQVPVVENIPLARALVASVKVGTTIPAELYLAVAEVLAYVIRQRQRAGAGVGGAAAA